MSSSLSVAEKRVVAALETKGATIDYHYLGDAEDGELIPGHVHTVMLDGKQFVDNDMRLIASLPAVERVWIQNANATEKGVDVLADLQSIRQLLIERSPISEDGLASLGRLENLEHLILRGLKANGSTWFTGCRNWSRLRVLEISDCPIQDGALQGLDNCRDLSGLALVNTRVTERGLLGCRKLRNLVSVNLTGSPVGDAALDEFVAIERVCVLDLQSGKLSDRTFSRHRLVSAYLESAWFRSMTIFHGRERLDPVGGGLLIDLSQVETVPRGEVLPSDSGDLVIERLGNVGFAVRSIEEEPVQEAAEGILRAYLKREDFKANKGDYVTGIQLNNSDYSSKIVELLNEARHLDLQFLNVSGINLSDRAVNVIASLNSLRVLIAGDCQLTDSHTKSLAGIASLRELVISGNPAISGGSINYLRGRHPELTVVQ